MWKNAKYLLGYLTPLAVFLGIYYKGLWSFSGIYVGFVLIPLLELFLPGSAKNHAPEKEESRARSPFFDLLLYLNAPLLYLLITYYFNALVSGGLMGYEIVGMTLSVGMLVGTIGINVAHELGHRSKFYEGAMSKFLLMSALYMHFNIEHNRGHHKNVATGEDPASARKGESVYAFWLRSVSGSFANAWRLENDRLRKAGHPVGSWRNEMIRFQFIQLGYLTAVGLAYGWWMTGYAVAIAIVGFLMLECVNYIEHYGLRRKKLPSGRYEKVSPKHSWNSNHELGRILLYELTRHSDHHYKATRKYQVLRHFDDSPQLPYGYPASIILSLYPPLWFGLMDKRVERVNRQQKSSLTTQSQR